MSSKPETFNTRFARLKEESGLSFAALSDAILARTGMQISHTALHKYMTDGNIDEPTLEALAKYFGKTPAWFRYGIGETPVNTFEVLVRMVTEVPEQPQQMVLQLLRYEFADNATRIVSEPGLSLTYAEFIDRVIKDMEQKRATDVKPETKPTKLE